MKRYVPLTAILGQILGALFLPVFFGSVPSLICWIALTSGGPKGFLIGPIFVLLLCIFSIIKSFGRLTLLSHGIIVDATVIDVKGLGYFVNRREAFGVQLRFFDTSQTSIDTSIRMFGRKRYNSMMLPRDKDKRSLPTEGDTLKLIYTPQNPNAAVRLDEISSMGIKISDEIVQASILPVLVLAIPTLIFILINCVGIMKCLETYRGDVRISHLNYCRGAIVSA